MVLHWLTVALFIWRLYWIPSSFNREWRMPCVFEGLKETSHLEPHSETVSRSLLSTSYKYWRCWLLLFGRSTELKSVVSSAYITSLLTMLSGRSLMYNRKRVGPNTEPWGTPALTCLVEDRWPSRTTEILRPSRKDASNLCTWPTMPYEVSFWRRPWCHTLSNAFEMSNATETVSPCLSRI